MCLKFVTFSNWSTSKNSRNYSIHLLDSKLYSSQNIVSVVVYFICQNQKFNNGYIDVVRNNLLSFPSFLRNILSNNFQIDISNINKKN